MEIRFAHTTDWHIGLTQYRRTKRWKDIINSAIDFKNQIIPLIKNKEISFILHTGDIYDTYHPYSSSILQLFKILNEIRSVFIDTGFISDQDNSPFYIIRGNHDAPSISGGIRSGTALDVLHEQKVVTYIKDEVFSPAQLKNVVLYGIGYFGIGIKDKVHDIIKKSPLDQGKCNILMLHTGIKEYLNNQYFADISQNDITKFGFAYNCVGHYHVEYKDELHRVGNPGSLEHVSMHEWSDDSDTFHNQKTWHLISLKKIANSWEANISKNIIEVRPKKRLIINLKGKNVETVTKELNEGIKPFLRPNFVIHVDIYGRIPEGMYLPIFFDAMLQSLDNPPLYFNYQPYSYVPKQIVRGINEFSDSEIIKEFLKSNKISKKSLPFWIKGIGEATRLLSKKSSYQPDSDEILQVEQLIKDIALQDEKITL